MLQFELPYPPSINHYWRRVGLRTLTGKLVVHVEVFPPDNRRRDIDNLQKALLDALEHGGTYIDDSQIVKLTIEKRPPVKGGKTLVRIGTV